VLKGKGYFNGKEVKKGQGFLIRANERVEYFSDENDPWQYFWVILTGTAADEVCWEYLYLNEDNIFNYADYAELYDLIERIFSSKLTQAKALSFFYDILSFSNKEKNADSNQYDIVAKEYIKVHLGKPFQVIDIAKSMGISDRYLYNLFIKYVGISPKEYINNAKIAYAEKLLKNSRSSIAEIATSVGYEDALAFSRFFSKKKDVSPSEYRKMHCKII
jgi:AraC-like DNA-binding protein